MTETKVKLKGLDWINHYLNSELKMEEINSILLFTIYWNVLEHYKCDDKFSIKRIMELVSEYKLKKEDYNEYYIYFKEKYFFGYGIDSFVESLKFRNNGDKDFLKITLASEDPTAEQVIGSLFLIIQRLRNNLFHGIKEARFLSEQERNFTVANEAIATFLENTK